MLDPVDMDFDAWDAFEDLLEAEALENDAEFESLAATVPDEEEA